MRFNLYLVLMAFVIVWPFSAQAQSHDTYCADVESTAATQTCLKKYLDSAQGRLNKIYDELSLQLDTDKKSELTALQKTWLAYRDAECSWEARSSENSSLKYINELSCMARLTEDRADILTTIGEETLNDSVTREYGSFPRWMNVVAKENPDVYWNYGSRQAMDLNCDEQNEHIMVGRTQALIEVPQEIEEGGNSLSTFSSEVAISIAQNPSIGRPKATIFKFNEAADVGADKICNDNIEFSVVEKDIPAELPEQSDAEEDVCLSRLQIVAKGCDPHYIEWTGEDFTRVENDITTEQSE